MPEKGRKKRPRRKGFLELVLRVELIDDIRKDGREVQMKLADMKTVNINKLGQIRPLHYNDFTEKKTGLLASRVRARMGLTISDYEGMLPGGSFGKLGYLLCY